MCKGWFYLRLKGELQNIFIKSSLSLTLLSSIFLENLYFIKSKMLSIVRCTTKKDQKWGQLNYELFSIIRYILILEMLKHEKIRGLELMKYWNNINYNGNYCSLII